MKQNLTFKLLMMEAADPVAWSPCLDLFLCNSFSGKIGCAKVLEAKPSRSADLFSHLSCCLEVHEFREISSNSLSPSAALVQGRVLAQQKNACLPHRESHVQSPAPSAKGSQVGGNVIES